MNESVVLFQKHSFLTFSGLSAEEMDRGCRQLILDHHKWIMSFQGHHHRLPCVFGDILDQIDMKEVDDNLPFQEKRKLIDSMPLRSKQVCYTHGFDNCPVLQHVDIDMSGLPCPDNSRANSRRLFEEGPSAPIYILWAKKHKELATPLLILENTPDPLLLVGAEIQEISNRTF